MFGSLLYVSLTAIFLAGFLSVWSKLSDDLRTSEVLSLASAMESSARLARNVGNAYPERSGLQNMVTSSMHERLNGASTVRTPWGGQMLVFAGDDITRDMSSAAIHRNRFVMQIADLPERACTAVAIEMLRKDRAESVHVDATQVSDAADVLDNCSDTLTSISVVFR